MDTPYGHFSRGGRSFTIVTPDIPRNWYNYFYTDNYVTFTSQCGVGQGFLQDRLGRRLMPVKARGLYAVEGDGGWSLLGLPVYEKYEAYSCEHCLGSTTVSLQKHGIRTEYTLFVPCEEDQYTGAEANLVRVTNVSDRRRELKLICYIDNDFDGSYRLQAYNTAAAYKDGRVTGVHFDFEEEFDGEKRPFCFFLTSDRAPDGWDLRRNAFIGTYGTLADPAALHAGGCTNSDCVAEKMGFAVQRSISLGPGESRWVCFIAGLAPDTDAARALTERFDSEEKVLKELKKVEEKYSDRLDRGLSFSTPDEKLNALLNVWLKYQTDMGSRWARVRHNGYRDIASDTECLACFHPRLAWERIKRLLTYQYSNGYAPRTFIDGQIRDNNFADCTVWLTFTVYYIVTELGDLDLLNEEVPFNDGSTAAVYEHIRRSVDFLYGFTGLHGLVRIWGGDWNDCMNNVGIKDKGVSVWLSIAWVRAARQLASLMRAIGKPQEEIDGLEARTQEMCRRINEYGWDEQGGYYMYAISDDGEPVGADACCEGKVFLNPQLWAVLVGGLGEGREERAIANAYCLLHDPLGTRVSWPPYTAKSAWIGSIAQKAPGVQENGGVYLHAMCWKLAVDALRGDEKRVKEDVECILPFRNPVVNGRAEPYIICNCYMGRETGYRYGTPGQSWRTASGQWFLKAMAQFVFGLQPTLKGLCVRPCLPEGWNEASAEKEFRGCRYCIRYRRTGEKALYFNGKKLPGDLLPLESGEVLATF
ncbi:MAG: hypothetical protein II912_00360 [Clostridia bacterium]|nr:hypothetical protein [Clostridia bacterium]